MNQQIYTKALNEEKKVKELLDNLPCGAGFYELVGDEITAVYVNDRYKMMMGREVGNPSEKPAFDVVHPDDRGLLLQEVKQAIAHERDVSCDIRILYGEADYRAYHVAGRVVERDGDRFSIYATYIPGGLATFRISQEQVSAQYLSESVYELVGYPKDADRKSVV